MYEQLECARQASLWAVVGVMVCWLLVVLVGFAYFARCSTRSTERFRLSLGFAVASIVFPPFAMVPICLNARD